jgi:pimeloyl-ACP methyl ester carboxylesterase
MRSPTSPGARPRARSLARAALPLALAAAAAAPAAAPAATLRWHPCATKETPKRLQCASLRVPLDPARPGGRTIRIALDRLPALDRAHRIGPLLVNPGGPGGSGVGAVAGGLFSGPPLAAVSRRFDVVGFDPRGIGASTRLRCGNALARLGTPPQLVTEAQFAAFRAANRSAGLACRRRTGRALFDRLDSRYPAHDIDAIRRALGARRISWFGISYGTELGQEYADRFPRRVRAMVLDGAVDHARSARRALVEEAASEAGTFQAFADWCAATPTCALHGQDVLAVLDRLTAQGDAAGVPDSALGRPATGTEITKAAYNGLLFTAVWPQLAAALARADGQAGPADAAALVDEATVTADPVYRTVGCADLGGRLRSAADAQALLARVRAVAPHSWRYTEFWDVMTGCTGWPVRVSNPPAARRIAGVPPVLVIGNTSDPSTPIAWARGLARRIARSRLLVHEGAGHTALLNSACATRRAARYLVTRRLPARGTVCRR